MWFKTPTIYSLLKPEQLEGLEETLSQAKFLPVGQAEMLSSGWSPVLEGRFLFRSHDHILLNFTVEKKTIPGSAVKLALAEKLVEVTKAQGFAPGRKQAKELKEALVDELCARVLPIRKTVGVWIDVKQARVIIDTTATKVMELIHRALVSVSGVELGDVEKWPGRLMPAWAADPDDLPEGYTVDDAIQLEYPGERGTTVAFKKADLSKASVLIHIADGACVTSMAMTFNDRISFTLMPITQLRGVTALDVLKNDQVERDVDAFENDFILMTCEQQALITSLINNA